MAKLKGKKNNAKNTIKKGTLDQKHSERLTRFEKLQLSLPVKREKLIKYNAELQDLLTMNPNKYTHSEISRKSYLLDAINTLQNEIKSIENCYESLNYIVTTLPILVDYYDNVDIIDDTIEEDYSNDTQEYGKKNILSYFINENNKQNDIDSGNNLKNSNNNDCDHVAKKQKLNNDYLNHTTTKKISRAKLYDNYLAITEANHKKQKKNSNMCEMSNCNGEKIFSQNDGCIVCNKCGNSEGILVAVEKPNYKEPTQDSGTYAYKRINHLTEILSQLQAKESTDIPSKVFENILREVKKRKINKDDLDFFRLRRILKKLNYRKYYEHVPHILQIINGNEPPNFSRVDELKIKKMFKDIQTPFTNYCPKNRKNFLNYSYVLHKICELLDLDDYIGYFPLLKNNTKLLQHDRIWKNICAHMKWKFYKSL